MRTLFRKNDKKGSSSIEFVVIVGILAILFTITVGELFAYINQAKVDIDHLNLKTLNYVTVIYSIRGEQNKDEDPFEKESSSLLDSDEYLMQILVDNRLLDEMLTPLQKGFTYAWNVQRRKWELRSKPQ